MPRYSDLPKPEDGLAEWASKIKALQQQVDADEEAEHKRLEEEIAASRMARMRRSRVVGNTSRTSSVDFGMNEESLASLKEKDDDPKSGLERQQDQSDELTTASAGKATSSFTRNTTSTVKPPEPMSLAAFMGGRAIGPRLNKHAPQQDAHDPTQFEQRTVASINSPHPIFGKGGVAMPGMTGTAGRSAGWSLHNESSSGSTSFSESTNDTSSYSNGIKRNGEPSVERSVSPQKIGGRERTLSTPDVKPIVTTSSVPWKADRPSSSASGYKDEELPTQKTGSRDRTISTPSPSYDFKPPMSPPAFRNNVTSRYTETIRERPASPQKMGSRERTMSIPVEPKIRSVSPASDSKPQQRKTYFPLASKTSTEDAPLSNPSTPKPSSPPHHSPITTPALAGPIRPQPRTSLSPQISTSPNPSPAFLRPPPQKEPTPSLSRLKGRGFVQNMVKASLQLETSSASSSQTSTPEKSISSSRKVLDRWQHQGSASPPTASPPASPKPNALRKTHTIDSPVPVVSPQSTKPEPAPKPKPKGLKPSVSFSSLTETIPPEPRKPEPKPKPVSLKPSVSFSTDDERSNVPKQPTVANAGLGSATTLVVFKSESNIAPFIDMSELGVKRDSTSPSARNLPVSSGKPLIHPTRERARKPKKQSNGTKHEETSPAPKPAMTPSGLTVVDVKVLQLDQGSSSSTIGSSVNGNTGRVVDRWANQNIIGVKPVLSREPSEEKSKVIGMVGRRALPGLAIETTPTPPRSPNISRSASQESSQVAPPALSGPKYPSEHRGPIAPRSRIPSTGNRPTVMDVAETMSTRSVSPEPQPEPVVEEQATIPEVVLTSEPIPEPTQESVPVPQLRPPSFIEKRKSSYERYSAIVLPPLQEEATPASTPAGTLRSDDSQGPRTPVQQVFKPSAVNDEISSKKQSRIVHISHVDEPLPRVDIESLIKSHPHVKRRDLDSNPISVEVMSIIGNSTTAIPSPFVFYDSELLVVVHRSKSKASGLVTTSVWGWHGKNCTANENEDRKLEELAKRYGTSPNVVHQYHEPIELLHILGDQLAIRQGVRAHWSADNTAMHVVRSKKGIIYIDEVDLAAKNLCSGFSYCLVLLETVYVWYGVGSIDYEREAALQYGKSLSNNVVEVTQGENDGNEMFWMILGDEEYAQAHYWKWRPAAADAETKIWQVNTRAQDLIMPVSSLKINEISSGVHILDCVWELFVLVGRKVRGNRSDIRLALSIATQYSTRIAPRRPFKPPVHVVVLPSQLPLDLKLHFRELDDSAVNGNDVPDHMNLMSTEEATDHLRRKSWETFALRDKSFLPLGMDPSQIT